MTTEVGTRLLRYVQDELLFDEPGLALLAVSGGADSIALLGLMVAIAGDLDLDLAIAHVDHGILGGSRDVACRVEKLAKRFSLRCYIETLALGPGTTETVARVSRYEALRGVQRRVGAKYLVTAHHADDQVETVLYRFLRGSGTAGLAGIASSSAGGLRRPLLPFRKSELVSWMEATYPDPESRPPVFDDPSNVDPRHDRSWLRTELLPLLRDRFGPGTDDRLLDVARQAASERAAWSQILRVLPELELSGHTGVVEVARAPFQRYHKVLSEGILRALAREAGCVVGPKCATRLRQFLAKSSSGHRFELGSGWEAEIVFSRLRIAQVEPPPSVRLCEPVVWGAKERGSAAWREWEFEWVPEPAKRLSRGSFCTWVTLGAGEIRVQRTGDRIFPLGGVGRRRVRRLLMEAGVRSRDRAAYPIVVRGGEVIWIPGVCRSELDVPRVGEPSMKLEARAGANTRVDGRS